MPEYTKIARVEEIPSGDGLVVRINGREVGLFLVEGEVHAIDNICPHRQGPLAEGILDGKVISCPWHAWTFDITTGKCTFAEHVAVEKFPVRVNDGAVEILVPSANSAGAKPEASPKPEASTKYEVRSAKLEE